MHNFQTDWLGKWAYYTPEKFFLREHDRDIKWSFREFNNCTNSLANYIKDDLKIGIGERIAVYSKNRAEYVMLYLACIKIGVILVPLNFRLTPRELDTLISDADPKMFIYEKDYEEQAKKINAVKNIPIKFAIDELERFLGMKNNDENFIAPRLFTENDVTMILYTAGTTGLSKGVMITNKMLYWNAINTCLRLDITSNDHTQSYAPFFHTGGWNVLFTPFLLHGASHTLLQSFDPKTILELMEREKTTLLFGVPTMLQMLSDLPNFEETDLSSCRFAIVGGAAMPIPLINIWHKKGIVIRQGYGLTEVGPNCFSLHQDHAIAKIGSIGYPNFYIEAKIMNEEGNECNANEVGELWMRSPVVTPGYWKKLEETEEALTDGYFHTGDLVKRDEDGFYFVVDRKKNMFISGGENVYPAEIEKYLYTNPKIKEVAVIGVSDSKWGEVGKAFVVLMPDEESTEEEIINFCKGNLAKYKIPKYIQILEEIPKTDAGKINKLKLTEIHKTQTTNS